MECGNTPYSCEAYSVLYVFLWICCYSSCSVSISCCRFSGLWFIFRILLPRSSKNVLSNWGPAKRWHRTSILKLPWFELNKVLLYHAERFGAVDVLVITESHASRSLHQYNAVLWDNQLKFSDMGPPTITICPSQRLPWRTQQSAYLLSLLCQTLTRPSNMSTQNRVSSGKCTAFHLGCFQRHQCRHHCWRLRRRAFVNILPRNGDLAV